MWILLAFTAAFCAGMTAVLSKVSLDGLDSHLATALRTIVVLVFAWGIVLFGGTDIPAALSSISGQNWLFLILSSIATGMNWLCYYRALQLSHVSKVAPVDKMSTVLTMVLAFIIFGEPIRLVTVPAMILMLSGTLLMAIPARAKKSASASAETAAAGQPSRAWIFYAVAACVSASLVAILGKLGLQGIDSNLATAIRTVIVLAICWGIVFVRGKQSDIPSIKRRNWIFLGLSGITTGLSWIFHFRALQLGPASIVVPIDRLSVLVSVIFSALFLKEPQNRRTVIGVILMTAGTIMLIL